MANVKELHVNGARRPSTPTAPAVCSASCASDLGLTGPKYGCGEGQCGACTVLLDGGRARSCVTRLDAAQGKKVQTIEGLADGDKLPSRSGGVPGRRRVPVRLLHARHDHVGRRVC